MIEILFSESAAASLLVAACNGNYIGGVWTIVKKEYMILADWDDEKTIYITTFGFASDLV